MPAVLGAASMVLVGVLAGGCPADEQTTSLFPVSYRSSYVEVRPCRPSGDHDLNNVRVIVDPAAAGPYQMRTQPFPTGAVALKEEYDFADDTCSGPLKLWTVMVKLAPGSAAAQLDWHWQKVDANRTVVTDNEPRCYSCHTICGVPPDGYQATCSMP